jgi:hypothetical protein
MAQSNTLKIEPFITDSLANFTFAGLTITSNTSLANLTVGNSTANSQFGNGTINANGNITTQQFFVGNGYYLTSVQSTASSISNGTSNIATALNGNITISIAGTANVVVVNSSGITSAHFTGEAGNLSNITAGNITGIVANANYASYVNTVIGATQSNITSLGLLTGLSVNGNTSVIGNSNIVGNLNQSGGTSYLANITSPGTVNFTAASNISLGSNSNIKITGGNSGQVLTTDGNGNLSWTSATSGSQAAIISNISSLIAGDAISISADYSNSSYPGGVFTINQVGPVTMTVTDQWSISGSNVGTSKNAYANYLASSVNTANVNISISLGNATFNVQSSDTITIGSSTVTGANLLALNINGTGGIYTIPSTYLTGSGTQTTATDTVSISLTNNRSVNTASGTTLLNTQPVAFSLNTLSGSFASTSVPYFNVNQTFSWSTNITGTPISGNITYTSGANGSTSLTSTGGVSGTSGSINSLASYTLTTSDYRGSGLYGYGNMTIPTTVTGTVAAATVYYPLFWKITSSSSNPSFTTTDNHNSNNYALGQGATSDSTPSDYLWIATPGATSHTFQYVFLGSNISITPNVTYSSQTISGYTYNVYGFTGSQAPTFIYTIT